LLFEQFADSIPVSPKRGAQIAKRIRQKILRDRLPMGHLIGSEGELIIRYSVSRSTIREAIRQLEAEGATTTRRGNGGGLIVAESPQQSVMQTLASHMELIDVPLPDLFEVLIPLEIRAAGLAAEHGQNAQIVQLRELAEQLAGSHGQASFDGVDSQVEIRKIIASMTGNQAMELFIGALSRSILELVASGRGIPDFAVGFRSGAEKKQRMIEAIAEGEPEAAAEAMREDLMVRQLHILNVIGDEVEREEREGALGEHAAAREGYGYGYGPKLAQKVAVRLAQRIARKKMRTGEALGTEMEFLKRLGVSRTTFREAIRLLELHGIVHARRGYLGGLTVGKPDPRYTIQLAASYIKHLDIDLAHLEEVRELLAISASQLAARRGDLESRRRLSAALRVMMTATGVAFPQAAIVVQHYIAEMSGNRALSLLIDVMLATNWTLQKIEPSPDSILAFRDSNRSLVEAILASDEPLARQRAVEHVRRSRSWVESGANGS
jgi:DNA-binding FadR family transcriptional regulator